MLGGAQLHGVDWMKAEGENLLSCRLAGKAKHCLGGGGGEGRLAPPAS